MSSEHGHGTGPTGTAMRHVGGMRCRSATGAATTPGPEAGWAYDILQVIGRTVVTEVAGEIDLRTGAILRKRLFELLDAGFGHIIIDFEKVRFCDAAGLGVLVAVHNRLRADGGSISLARVRPAQRRLLEVAGLGRVFALYDSVPGAVRGQERPTTASTG